MKVGLGQCEGIPQSQVGCNYTRMAAWHAFFGKHLQADRPERGHERHESPKSMNSPKDPKGTQPARTLAGSVFNASFVYPGFNPSSPPRPGPVGRLAKEASQMHLGASSRWTAPVPRAVSSPVVSANEGRMRIRGCAAAAVSG